MALVTLERELTMETVSDILTARANVPAGLRGMIVASLGIHIIAMTAILLMRIGPGLATPRTVIDISFSSAPGLYNGGANSIGRQAVQVVRTLDANRVATTPQPAKAFALAARSEAKSTPSSTNVPHSRPEARSATRVPGEQPTEGATIAATGATALSFGLTTGGAGTGGHQDVTDFCCPDLSAMVQLIQGNWTSRQDVTGETQVRFTIARDGRIADVIVEASSGYFALDQTAERAVRVTTQVPPLPRSTRNMS